MWRLVSGFIRRNPAVFSGALLGGAVAVGVIVVLLWWWASDDDNGDDDSDTAAAEVQSAVITPAGGLLMYPGNPQVFAVTVKMTGAVSGDTSFDVSIEEVIDIDRELEKIKVTIKDQKTSGSGVFILRCVPAHPFTLIGNKGREVDEAEFDIRPTADGVDGEEVDISCSNSSHPTINSSGDQIIGDGVREISGFDDLLEKYLEKPSLPPSN